MHWLVTGGCGFIGRNLIRHLLASRSADSVRVIDNYSTGHVRDLEALCPVDVSPSRAAAAFRPGRAHVLRGDILDRGLALDALADVDVVVHLAANTGVPQSVGNPRHDCVTNVIGTLNYLEAARRQSSCRFVFASSSAPLGDCVPPLHEELPAHPTSPYGASKLAGEAYCSAYARSFGLETVCLRFGNVYGPHSTHKSSVVASFIKHALDRQPLVVYGDGRQTRDFIYIDDLADAIIASATTRVAGGEVFQIATCRETSINQLATELMRVLASLGVPPVPVASHASRAGEVRNSYADTSKAARLLGWTARTRLEDGLTRTAEWFVTASKNRNGAYSAG